MAVATAGGCGCKLYVSRLPFDINDAELKYVFGSYGSITQVDLLGAAGAAGQASAFITYDSLDSAQTAIRTLHDVYKIRVDATEPISVTSAELFAAADAGVSGAGIANAALGATLAVPGGAAPPGSNFMVASQLLAQQPFVASPLLAPGQFGFQCAPAHVPNEQVCKLFVGDLPGDITKEVLEHVFSTYGTVTAARVMPGRARSGAACAFVEYSNAQSAATAINTLHQKYEIRPGAGPIIVRYFEGGKGKGKAAAAAAAAASLHVPSLGVSSLGDLAAAVHSAGLAGAIGGVAETSMQRASPY